MIMSYVLDRKPTHAMQVANVNFHLNQRKLFVFHFHYAFFPKEIYSILFIFVIRRIQFGLWDGSIESGTAEWSRGPIDVSGN